MPTKVNSIIEKPIILINGQEGILINGVWHGIYK